MRILVKTTLFSCETTFVTFSKAIRTFTVFSALIGLMACQSSGTEMSASPPLESNNWPFSGATGTEVVPLSFASLNSEEMTTHSGDGQINRSANTASIAGMSGQIDAEQRILQLSSGGQITLTSETGQFAARFEASPRGGQTINGVVGVSTLVEDMPGSGLATYSGDTKLTARIGADLYELRGTAEILANFGTNATVDTTLDGLSGRRITGLSTGSAVSDVGTITIRDAIVTSSRFAGGASSSTGDTLALSGVQTTSVSGQFFGPNAVEAGGVFVIDDTASGGVLIQGDFLGSVSP